MEVDQAGGEVPAMGDAANNNPLSPIGAAAVIEPIDGVGDGSVVAGAGTAGSITVSLHPLVIMNISEHWTRTRAQNDGKSAQVLGAIIGQHKGRHLEIMNSFELVISTIDGLVVIDRDYYRTKEEQFKQVFSEMDFLGWYTTGDVPSPADIHVHKQICEIYESPVLLKLNPLARNVDQLPVFIYESIIDIVSGDATMLFVQLPYVLATEEAERIGVDHVARMSASEASESSLVADHLASQHSAIKMLHSRVRLILDYVRAVEKGEAPMCHDALRLAKSLSHRLPVIQPDRFKTDFYEQCSDVSLITYLGMITKGCEEAHQFITRFNMLHEKYAAGSRRMRDNSKRVRLDSQSSVMSMFRYGDIGGSRRGSGSSTSGMTKGKIGKKMSSKKSVNQISDNELNQNQDLSRAMDVVGAGIGDPDQNQGPASPAIVNLATGAGHEDSFDDPLEMD
ncbi:COP9 signalosome complex subunit 6 [Orchesella cincta]|uniref:COP9 signalosome complex subunit 6 n=1 Tax=Orchesella cincta TaxID=48709 RepID=A0A1D2MLH7_ORCCI|nr:COP9 signalosome complex subunit 6 [Orchesella cincta]